ncbi:Fatty acid hydroxylase [Metarhizium album ARSEF 1941]|uniref:Fatty acid hydroxylase n=1 Tax=Metarhizium album (strain ARSEF 1941) TaxID=1081103 RepID=A0A0B2WW13_METAS|nr:Fatty acid hydroxylase [Metarhizium album ARSEF 1941]KHN97100.1 Fatty acid hydroxylase [Metarhizium album ARSEF 1941]
MTTATHTQPAAAVTATATATASTTPRGQRDSIKSTWRTRDRSTWTFSQKLIDWVGVHPVSLDQPVPQHAKSEKVPHLGQVSQHIWILVHGCLPLALHQAVVSLTGWPMGRHAAFHFYMVLFNAIVIREVRALRRLGHQHGFLDGDAHARDGVPDHGAAKVVWSLYKTIGARLALMLWLTYAPSQPPLAALSSWRWWAALPLQTGLYALVLDFWFYLYHRAMHDVPFLWRFHRTHHLTKHPNPLLSAYADEGQEFFDMAVIPLLAYASLRALGMPLDFYAWWMCQQYVVYTEVWGHSGVRVHLAAPSTLSWLLTALDMELCVEDHDLHHRRGWRRSQNYGKQTRVWDRLFGTCGERLESYDDNVDYVNQAYMPIF